MKLSLGRAVRKPSPAPGVYPSPLVVHNIDKMIASTAACMLSPLPRKALVHPNRVSSELLIPNG